MYWGQMGHGHIVRGLAEWRRGEQKASPFSFLNEEIIYIMYSPFVESLFIVNFFFFLSRSSSQPAGSTESRRTVAD